MISGVINLSKVQNHGARLGRITCVIKTNLVATVKPKKIDACLFTIVIKRCLRLASGHLYSHLGRPKKPLANHTPETSISSPWHFFVNSLSGQNEFVGLTFDVHHAKITDARQSKFEGGLGRPK